MKEDWIEVLLGDLISPTGVFCDGDWVESKDQDLDGEIRLIQLADIGDGIFKDKSHRFLTFKKSVELNCTYLKHGDILLARMPEPLGRATIFPLEEEKKYVTVVDVAIIRAGNNYVYNKFLLYNINSPHIRKKIASWQSGSTRKRISRKNLSKIHFPLAPLPIQRAIVLKIENLFASLDKGIADLKTAREQLKVYRQAVLKKAFEGRFTHKNLKSGEFPEGWKWVKLRHVTDNVQKVKRKEKNDNEEFLYVDISGIDNSLNKIVSHKVYLWKDSPSRAQQIIKTGDILFSTVRTYLKNIAFVNNAIYENQICSSGFSVIRPNEEKTIPKYLYYYSISEEFIRPLNELQKGSSYPAIRSEDVFKQHINIPEDIDEQRIIVREIESRLSVCDKVEQSINEALEKAEALRQSILKRAFDGKLLSEAEIVKCKQEADYEPASVLLERIKKEK